MQSERKIRSRWVDSRAAVDEMVEHLLKVDCVAVDTEFIRETTFYPKVALIQVATEDKAWLVDPLRLSKENLAGFEGVMKDPKTLKVMHAALGDQECFFHEYGFVVSPVIDTAAAAALLGYGDSVGLAKLLKIVMGLNLPKGRARVHWLDRPLAPELMQYAEEDVIHLVELARRMLVDLDKAGRREWALKTSQHPEEMFRESVESVAHRVARGSNLDAKAMGCLYELVVWREMKARSLNRPRGWIADNSVLTSLAKSRPKSLAELSRFRGLNGKEIERSGKQILEALERGASRKLEIESREIPPPSQDEELVMNLLKAFLNMLATNNRLATRLLISSDQLLPLLRAGSQGIPSWVEQGLMTDDVARIIGVEVEAFLMGRCAIKVQNGKLAVIPEC